MGKSKRVISSPTDPKFMSAEQRAAHAAQFSRLQHFHVRDADGREVMLSYHDGVPHCIGVVTAPNVTTPRYLAEGEPFEAFQNNGEPWAYPGPDAPSDPMPGDEAYVPRDDPMTPPPSWPGQRH